MPMAASRSTVQDSRYSTINAHYLIRYHAPDDLPVEESRLAELPENWRNDQPLTRRLGSAWLDRAASCMLRVPSVVVPVPESDDRNIVINHRHQDAARITISSIEKFAYDPRLLNDAPGGSRD